MDTEGTRQKRRCPPSKPPLLRVPVLGGEGRCEADTFSQQRDTGNVCWVTKQEGHVLFISSIPWDWSHSPEVGIPVQTTK